MFKKIITIIALSGLMCATTPALASRQPRKAVFSPRQASAITATMAALTGAATTLAFKKSTGPVSENKYTAGLVGAAAAVAVGVSWWAWANTPKILLKRAQRSIKKVKNEPFYQKLEKIDSGLGFTQEHVPSGYLPALRVALIKYPYHSTDYHAKRARKFADKAKYGFQTYYPNQTKLFDQAETVFADAKLACERMERADENEQYAMKDGSHIPIGLSISNGNGNNPVTVPN